MSFIDRSDAGRQLSRLLSKYKGKDLVVYALPRGGVPVALEIALFLNAPLDLIFAHKIGHPYHLEYAIGAVSEGGHIIESEELKSFGEEWVALEKEKQMNEMRRKRELYMKNKKEIPLKGKIAIIVDDGIATGLTMQVGIKELRDRHPQLIVAAVPVAPKSTANLLKSMVDEFVAVEIPEDFQFLGAVGAYYNEFYQVDDQEVIELLRIAK